MNKSDIEWTEFTSNPVKGKCPVDCSYCYVKPLRRRYGWHDDIRFYPEELERIRRRKKPSRIFMGSTIELFHEHTMQYMPEIIETVKACPQHTFMFLTKQPQNLIKFSPFPDNCWVGVSATDEPMFQKAIDGLWRIDANVKYLSLEPLQGRILTSWREFQSKGIKWVIIGAQTKPTIMPCKEWVDEIVFTCDKAQIPVFIKNNLKPLLAKDGYVRQEMPNNIG